MELAVRRLEDGTAEVVGTPSHENGFFVSIGQILGYVIVSNEVIIKGISDDVVADLEMGDLTSVKRFIQTPEDKPGLHIFEECEPEMLSRGPRYSTTQLVCDVMEVAPYSKAS